MQPIKGKKYYKLDFTKLKAFCSVKDTVKRFKKTIVQEVMRSEERMQNETQLTVLQMQ